jgi:small-conductance mechanosensitive channel
LAKRQAAKEAGEGEAVIEEPTLDIEQVNDQSMRLIRLALLGGFIAALYWVWSDLISVFSYLDNVTLYEYTSGTGANVSMVPISIGDLLGALIIIGITFALARNLPGLLEVLVLSKLELAQGSAYATTTLLSYVIAGVGFVSTLSTLGVSWDKLQWLVAALSVGLGFGMQEIFANFISGIMILFERPVRIGDTITIGNLSGTVSKIRIRATTITDFDRKDIIVPNKTFITGQLINWSLTDTITRVTLKLGVDYGSDLDLVKELLLKAARENPRVLKDPEPHVYFLNFGESTLDHELRMHVRDLGDRNPVVDEVNRFINREFKKYHIKISFRQMEVYLKNLHGQEYKLVEVDTPAKPANDGGVQNATEQTRLNALSPAECSDILLEMAGESPRRTDLRQPLRPLGDAFSTQVLPEPLDEPRLVVASPPPWPCSTSTRRWPTCRCSPNCSAATSCGRSRPRAMVYSGTSSAATPALGDGRGLLLGEVYNDAGEHWDLHLKGPARRPTRAWATGARCCAPRSASSWPRKRCTRWASPPAARCCVIGSSTPVGAKNRNAARCCCAWPQPYPLRPFRILLLHQAARQQPNWPSM